MCPLRVLCCADLWNIAILKCVVCPGRIFSSFMSMKFDLITVISVIKTVGT